MFWRADLTSPFRKMEAPATNTVAPASTIVDAFSWSTPPSTSTSSPPESASFANCPDSVGSQTYVGSEVSICNVYMNHVCACFLHSPDLAFQVCMVSCKNRRRDLHYVHS